MGKEVNIETLPACHNCGKGTAIMAKFCEKCGASTVTRADGRFMDKKTGWYQSDGMRMTEDSATEEILKRVPDWIRKELIESKALMVKIVDIQNGKLACQKDPHGIQWAVYDPFARVGFYNPKTAESRAGEPVIEHLNPQQVPKTLSSPTHTPILIPPTPHTHPPYSSPPTPVQVPKIYQPASSHTRTLWCYLRSEGEEYTYGGNWRSALESAIRLLEQQKQLLSEQVSPFCLFSFLLDLTRSSQSPVRAARHLQFGFPGCAQLGTSRRGQHAEAFWVGHARPAGCEHAFEGAQLAAQFHRRVKRRGQRQGCKRTFVQRHALVERAALREARVQRSLLVRVVSMHIIEPSRLRESAAGESVCEALCYVLCASTQYR